MKPSSLRKVQITIERDHGSGGYTAVVRGARFHCRRKAAKRLFRLSIPRGRSRASCTYDVRLSNAAPRKGEWALHLWLGAPDWAVGAHARFAEYYKYAYLSSTPPKGEALPHFPEPRQSEDLVIELCPNGLKKALGFAPGAGQVCRYIVRRSRKKFR